MNLKNILKYAYEVELRGQRFYAESATAMKNEGARTVFLKLAQMEEDHQKYIRDFGEKIGVSFEEHKTNSEDYFEKRFEEISPKSSLQSDLGDLAALRLAYLIEHDLADFYRKAAAKTKDEYAVKMLEELAGWEDEHERMIREEYEEIMERSWAEAEFFPF